MRSPESRERSLRRQRERYANDPELRLAIVAQQRSELDQRKRFLNAVKTTAGCLDCGTSEGQLHFDHRPGEVKEFGLGQPSRSWPKLLREMDKCDVRCHSCHSRRHGREWRMGNPNRRAIIEFMRQADEPPNSRMISAAVGITEESVARILRLLEAEGVIERGPRRANGRGCQRVSLRADWARYEDAPQSEDES